MLENRMVVDSQWRYLEDDLTNLVAQPEHCGSDFYGTEILEGDEVAIDATNFHEEILKENLKRYLVENVRFKFFNIGTLKVALDVEKEMVIAEDDLEKYLHEEHGFIFKTAD